MTRRQYITFLIATQGNYTATHLAHHLDGVSHDTITDFLARDKVTPRQLWELTAPRIKDSERAFLLCDDSVQDKQHARKIELVRKQYSGNAHGVVRGSGLINLLHSDGQEFWPIDYRVFDPEGDGKTKHDHFREMLIRAKSEKRLQARHVLFDTWYTCVETLKVIHRLDRIFVAPIKSNRLISLSREAGYVHLGQIEWTPERLEQGVSVKLKELPFRVLLFKVVSSNGDIDWLITNREPGSVTSRAVHQQNGIRWQIEQMHRELKQLLGIERCQCRKARSQRNHLGLCYQAWVALRVKARQWHKTLYAARSSLFEQYLRAELRRPRIAALNTN